MTVTDFASGDAAMAGGRTGCSAGVPAEMACSGGSLSVSTTLAVARSSIPANAESVIMAANNKSPADLAKMLVRKAIEREKSSS